MQTQVSKFRNRVLDEVPGLGCFTILREFWIRLMWKRLRAFRIRNLVAFVSVLLPNSVLQSRRGHTGLTLLQYTPERRPIPTKPASVRRIRWRWGTGR